jgi:hypothetical protein
MAYTLKDVFYLDTSLATTTGTGEGIATLDLSAYIDPIARGKSKATGLAIYKVHFDIADDGSNDPVAATTNGNFRTAIMSNPGFPAAAVGSAAMTAETVNAGNPLVIAGNDYVFGGTAAGDPPQPYMKWLEPSEKVPYVVVRDSVILVASVKVAMGAASTIYARLECAQVTLDQATLNQLLRTQTV